MLYYKINAMKKEPLKCVGHDRIHFHLKQCIWSRALKQLGFHQRSKTTNRGLLSSKHGLTLHVFMQSGIVHVCLKVKHIYYYQILLQGALRIFYLDRSISESVCVSVFQIARKPFI